MCSIRKLVQLFLIVAAAVSCSLSAASSQLIVKDLVWTQVAGQPLKLDIYAPALNTIGGQAPVLIVYHGGGWLVNNKSIMDQMSDYVASHSELMVVNVDYRLLSANQNTTRMNQIVEDALGAVAWVKSHIAGYGGNPDKVAVTGDSAGGHLAAMVLMATDKLSVTGFTQGPIGFNPSYIPPGTSLDQLDLQVQAAVISYGALDLFSPRFDNFETAENGFWKWGNAEPRGIFGPGIDKTSQPEYYRALSPIALIPNVQQRRLPAQWLHVGSKDQLTTAELAQAYVDKLHANGQQAELTIYPGYNHAYLDNNCNEYLGHCFDRDAPVVLDAMIRFLQRELSGPSAH